MRSATRFSLFLAMSAAAGWLFATGTPSLLPEIDGTFWLGSGCALIALAIFYHEIQQNYYDVRKETTIMIYLVVRLVYPLAVVVTFFATVVVAITDRLIPGWGAVWPFGSALFALLVLGATNELAMYFASPAGKAQRAKRRQEWQETIDNVVASRK